MATTSVKTCCTCKESKNTSEFYIRKGAKDGFRSQCKICNNISSREWALANPEKAAAARKKNYAKNPKAAMAAQKRWQKRNPEQWAAIQRNNKLRRTYGITLEDYDRMFEEQQGRCGICSSEENNSKNTEHFYVDHCHATGIVRGLLCSGCNTGLGNFKDNEESLQAAIAYLRRQEN
jgi:hypothetical protein